MVGKNRIFLCETEVYFDEKIGCNVTLIKDTEGSMSSLRKKSNQWAKSMGFQDINHYEGFLYANGLFNEMREGFEVDVLHVHTSGEVQN